MVVPDIDYAVSGALTDLDGIPATALEPVPDDPVDACRPVHALVIQPSDAQTLNLSEHRLAENHIRPSAVLLRRLLAMDPSPVTVTREPNKRLVGTCRHFAVLSCALLRYRGIPARVRCGFATYFQPGQSLDHWITEYRERASGRWVRIDTEVLGQTVLEHPESLQPGDFYTGSEAWTAFRRRQIDAATFGVYGTDNWGPGEIRGNAVKDFAALNKVEMLPWDEWGRMTDAYDGKTGDDYDDLLDQLAAVSAADEPATVAALYTHEHLRVPPNLIG